MAVHLVSALALCLIAFASTVAGSYYPYCPPPDGSVPGAMGPLCYYQSSYREYFCCQRHDRYDCCSKPRYWIIRLVTVTVLIVSAGLFALALSFCCGWGCFRNRHRRDDLLVYEVPPNNYYDNYGTQQTHIVQPPPYKSNPPSYRD